MWSVGCPKMQLFFMSRCIWWLRLLENDFTFTIFDFVHYSSERCSKTKTKKNLHGAQSTEGMPLKIYFKKIADFWKFYCTTFLVNLHHFSYFDPAKKSANFFLQFSAAFLKLTAPHVNKFWFGFLSNAHSNSWRNRK